MLTILNGVSVQEAPKGGTFWFSRPSSAEVPWLIGPFWQMEPLQVSWERDTYLGGGVSVAAVMLAALYFLPPSPQMKTSVSSSETGNSVSPEPGKGSKQK